jgi:hypothetical protein
MNENGNKAMTKNELQLLLLPATSYRSIYGGNKAKGNLKIMYKIVQSIGVNDWISVLKYYL